MTVPLSPDTLAAAYSYLRTTPPFRSWKLPPACNVVFRVIADTGRAADFSVDGAGRPVIRVSRASNGHSDTLMASMAHEMIHLRQHQRGYPWTHGRRFRDAAARVCRVHGFDPKQF